jgi:6-pyruvoyltetrahydropterin/6-carboxytetrahydropterin synthase
MTYSISKEFDFCYGHRVWSQKLDKNYSLSECNSCRHLHGHQGKIIIHLSSKKLINDMVTDFNHLNWFKSFIDDTIDHKFIIDINDPLFATMLPHFANKNNLIDINHNLLLPDISQIKDEPSYIQEMYNSYVIVDFVPTSENISAWILQIVQEKMKKFDIRVSHIEFFESPKSKSIVYS